MPTCDVRNIIEAVCSNRKGATDTRSRKPYVILLLLYVRGEDKSTDLKANKLLQYNGILLHVRISVMI